MHFEERLHVQFARQIVKAGKASLIEHICHQQHGVGTKGPRLAYLIFFDDEILSQDGLCSRAPRRSQRSMLIPKCMLFVSTEIAATIGDSWYAVAAWRHFLIASVPR